MSVVAIVQARMSSTRLPGKVLFDLEGIPVLEHICLRLKSCKRVDKIVVATSNEHTDDQIYEWGKKKNISIFRGSLDDVLSRYYLAASAANAKIIIRITGDCPVIDPDIVDELVTKVIYKNYDYASLVGEFPDGLDCSVMTINALEKAYLSAKLKSEREHVCPYIEKNSKFFKIFQYQKFQKLGHHRWTLDEEVDFKLIKIIYKNLYKKGRIFKSQEILDFIDGDASLFKINSHIIRNEGYKKSLENDQAVQ